MPNFLKPKRKGIADMAATLLPQRQRRLLLLQVLLRPVLDPALIPLAQQLATQVTPLDTAWLVRTGVAERAATWLLPALDQVALPITTAERALLQRAASLEVQRTLQAEALRLALLPVLGGKQPLLLLLKGSSIEARAYPPGILRPCTDLDLLVAPGQFALARKALLQVGLLPGTVDASGRTQRFDGGTAGCAVDLHFRLGCPRRYPRYGTDGVVAAAVQRAVRLADGSRTLAPVDTTVHLLVHLAAGLGGDLRHLADANQWLATAAQQGVTAEQIRTLVAQLGLLRAVHAGLATLAALPGSAVAAQYLNQFRPVPRVDRALLQLQRRLVATHYAQHGPVLPPPLLAVTELATVDGLAGLQGLLALLR